MQSGLLLDVVIRKGTTVLQLFACEDQPLLVRWNAFLVLYFCLHVVNRVAGLDIEGDRLARGESSRRSAYHHEGAIPNATWTPSGCCSPKEDDRPPAVYLRRSAAAGLVECLPCLFAFTLSIVSLASTSRVIVLPVRVFTKICIPPRRRNTKCKVDSFWML